MTVPDADLAAIRYRRAQAGGGCTWISGVGSTRNGPAKGRSWTLIITIETAIAQANRVIAMAAVARLAQWTKATEISVSTPSANTANHLAAFTDESLMMMRWRRASSASLQRDHDLALGDHLSGVAGGQMQGQRQRGCHLGRHHQQGGILIRHRRPLASDHAVDVAPDQHVHALAVGRREVADQQVDRAKRAGLAIDRLLRA